MPRIARGGKFVFGWSVISTEGIVKIPDDAYEEYNFSSDINAILISGSKKSGGFCVSNHSLMKNTVMSGLFSEHPEIKNYSSEEGLCVKFKGRYYCWVKIRQDGSIRITEKTMHVFDVKPGDRLLSIRGSNVALVMAVKGPIINAAEKYEGVIEDF